MSRAENPTMILKINKVFIKKKKNKPHKSCVLNLIHPEKHTGAGITILHPPTVKILQETVQTC